MGMRCRSGVLIQKQVPRFGRKPSLGMTGWGGSETRCQSAPLYQGTAFSRAARVAMRKQLSAAEQSSAAHDHDWGAGFARLEAVPHPPISILWRQTAQPPGRRRYNARTRTAAPHG